MRKRMGNEFALKLGDQVLGYVQPVTGGLSGIVAGLACSGMALEPSKANRGHAKEQQPVAREIRMDKECSIEDKTPCEVKIALGVAEDMAREAGLPIYGKISAITERGYTNDAEATQVIQQFVREVDASPNCDDDDRGVAKTIAGALKLPQGGTAHV